MIFKGENGTLNSTDGSRGYIAVLCCEFRCILTDKVEHGSEVFQVDKKKSVVVRNFENNVKDSGLGLIELHEASEEVRTHIGYSGTHWMALLTEDIEETYRAALELGILDSELGKSLLNEAGEFSYLAYAG